MDDMYDLLAGRLIAGVHFLSENYVTAFAVHYYGERALSMKRFKGFILILAVLTVFSGCGHFAKDRDTLFQVSTIDALLDGIYDGSLTCGELKRNGDLGIGTFDGLDGEMVVYEGKVFQVKTDGVAYEVEDATKTPFAVVIFFDRDKTISLQKVTCLEMLKRNLDERLPTTNIFYAFKIQGIFDYIKTRSVPAQKKPYPPLVEVVKKQSLFEFNKAEGTILGFRSPDYVKGINVPGYHFHFITKDSKAGGHLLDCRMSHAEIEVDYTSRFSMTLPRLESFYQTDLSRDRHKELEKVEK